MQQLLIIMMGNREQSFHAGYNCRKPLEMFFIENDQFYDFANIKKINFRRGTIKGQPLEM